MTVARVWHEACFACGTDNDRGLGLDCALQDDGSTSATLIPETWMQGYSGRLQGGIITTVLDSAMCQCLHHHGIEAVTGSLQVRFHRPAPVDGQYRVSAWIDAQRHGAWVMRAELWLAGQRVARAAGIFFPMGQ